MELFGLSTAELVSGVLAILMIDLVLAGDNAIVIGMACCKLPKEVQLKAIMLGTAGAIVIRVLATIAVVWLLKIPGLMLGGGLLLFFIAYKLIAKPDDHGDVKSGTSLKAAIMTIIIADAAMGIDNVLAVAGASHGSYVLVVFGLAISIPIMVFCSTLIIKLINRFPIIIDIGAAIITYTAAKMITEEPLIHAVFANAIVKYGFIVLAIVGVVVIGRLRRSVIEKKANVSDSKIISFDERSEELKEIKTEEHLAVSYSSHRNQEKKMPVVDGRLISVEELDA